MKKASWFIFGFLCIVIGLYPLMYILVGISFFIENNVGFLSTKTSEVLNSTFWNVCFLGHIIFGGVALLIGWIQFSEKIRVKRLRLHRNAGKVYIISVFVSGICGLYIAFFATGGIISSLGFASLAIIWLTTTALALNFVRKGNIDLHQKMMTFSYAACFSAVTLRIWLPLLTISIGEFDHAYRIVAWLSWIPNIIVAHFINLQQHLNG